MDTDKKWMNTDGGRLLRPEELPVLVHPWISVFIPVKPCGQVTDYDKLSMQIETNGAVTPEDSVALAARILQDQLQLFINFEEPSLAQEESKVAEPPFNKNL